MSADPDIVALWIRGWTMSRAVPWPVRDGAAWRVDVNWPDQKARYVFDRMSDAVLDRVRQIDEPNVFVKVFALEEEVRPQLPPHWSYPLTGFFMTRDEPSQAGSLPDGYSLAIREAGQDVRQVVVSAADGAEAATGMVSWEQGHAVYNMILTSPDHQRKGLASQVMAALGRTAVEEGGVDHHMLVATPAGRELYTHLGWTFRSHYTTAVILPDDVA